MNRWIDGWMDGWMDRWTDGQMDRWTDEQMDKWTDGQMDRWTDGCFICSMVTIQHNGFQPSRPGGQSSMWRGLARRLAETVSH